MRGDDRFGKARAQQSLRIHKRSLARAVANRVNVVCVLPDATHRGAIDGGASSRGGRATRSGDVHGIHEPHAPRRRQQRVALEHLPCGGKDDTALRAGANFREVARLWADFDANAAHPGHDSVLHAPVHAAALHHFLLTHHQRDFGPEGSHDEGVLGGDGATTLHHQALRDAADVLDGVPVEEPSGRGWIIPRKAVETKRSRAHGDERVRKLQRVRLAFTAVHERGVRAGESRCALDNLRRVVAVARKQRGVGEAVRRQLQRPLRGTREVLLRHCPVNTH
mmetsp:Transcript_12948/g.32715  ORF Transcript_12948/g.32715 Transcript_12948/m.32715 type:complete len:280 (-) Transcript_12948:239-1078(-)